MIKAPVRDQSDSFSWTAKTHPGRVRQNNEDAFLALMFDPRELVYLGRIGEAPRAGWDFIFAVSDGMGGVNAGEFASKVTTQTVTELVSREFHQKKPSSPHDYEKLLAIFYQSVHKKTLHAGGSYEECRGMGATLSLCWFHGETLYLGHVGDSRIYHLPAEGPMRQLTEDHTISGRLRRSGKISEREARSHPYKHLLERSIGNNPAPVDPQILATPFTSGDRFVLCTDGITDGMWDKSIEKVIRTPPPYLKDLTPAERLIKEAMDTSGRDNLTAMVIEA